MEIAAKLLGIIFLIIMGYFTWISAVLVDEKKKAERSKLGRKKKL